MKVSIHQPNFMPWCPFFQKMELADVFVIMGNCQYEKGGYQNRFKYGEKWLTMSVQRGMTSIVDKRYAFPSRDWASLKERCATYKDKISIFDDCISENLFETNVSIIKRAKELLNIKCEIVYDYPTKLRSTERLVDICKRYSARTYISGVSGAQYLDRCLFQDADISLEFQRSEDMVKKTLIEVI